MVLVKIIYGPYEANGIIRHKKQRLWGLTNELKKLGYIVEFECTPQYGRLIIQMLNQIIFQCNITNLRFNCLYEDDVICQRIIKAVMEAETRLYSKTNMEKIREIIPKEVQLDAKSDESVVKMIEDYLPDLCYNSWDFGKQDKVGAGMVYQYRTSTPSNNN
ncbi:UPF0728 protein C10orf53 homolog [Chrysoperla carnea]|uniref:UPF0728 protein C10orf53 homolog n=1 Tax=Chrysoperla carnea TaxID=189513 RepID=UPI001D087AA1|nr:UPF0728 protein C10orf53 homolog [Chrysoperla carnea]